MKIFFKALIYTILFAIILATMWKFLLGESLMTSLNL